MFPHATVCGMRKMGNTKILAYLRPDQKQWLEKQAAKTGAPLTELIRRAIDAYKAKVK